MTNLTVYDLFQEINDFGNDFSVYLQETQDYTEEEADSIVSTKDCLGFDKLVNELHYRKFAEWSKFPEYEEALENLQIDSDGGIDYKEIDIELSKEEVLDLILGQTNNNNASLWLDENGGVQLLWDMQVGNMSGASKICNVRELSSSDYSDDLEIDSDNENYDEIYQDMMKEYKSDIKANLIDEYTDKAGYSGIDTIYKIEWID